MNLIETPLRDCFILEPKVFGDERGFFLESFNQKVFNKLTNTNYQFVQDNHSSSVKGVLRGLHYQKNSPQGKLVRVISGEVFDVAVDVRPGSVSQGKWFGLHLNAENKKQFWVPPGFAHGFVVLSERAEFLYKTTDYYVPSDEVCIKWNDEELNINWHFLATPTLSEKDKKGMSYKESLLLK
ncbi:MAG: dTDP-4-dehydrorhamnose 3,5-epimerase [Pseudobdellovibrio sp.]